MSHVLVSRRHRRIAHDSGARHSAVPSSCGSVNRAPRRSCERWCGNHRRCRLRHHRRLLLYHVPRLRLLHLRHWHRQLNIHPWLCWLHLLHWHRFRRWRLLDHYMHRWLHTSDIARNRYRARARERARNGQEPHAGSFEFDIRQPRHLIRKIALTRAWTPTGGFFRCLNCHSSAEVQPRCASFHFSLSKVCPGLYPFHARDGGAVQYSSTSLVCCLGASVNHQSIGLMLGSCGGSVGGEKACGLLTITCGGGGFCGGFARCGDHGGSATRACAGDRVMVTVAVGTGCRGCG